MSNNSILRKLTREQLHRDGNGELLTREWLVTNGLGGYASGTISGVATRRYHGLLIAALPGRLGRRLLLSHLSDRVRLPDGTLIKLSGELNLHASNGPPVDGHLVEFRLELGLPVWRYEFAGFVLERQVFLAHEQNTAYVLYRLLDGNGTLRLKVLPSVHNRSHDDPVNTPLPGAFQVSECDGHYEVHSQPELPSLRLLVLAERQAFTIERKNIPEVLYPIEESRGYDFRGQLWSPGYFRFDLTVDHPAALIASTASWEQIKTLTPDTALEAERERRLRLLNAAPPEAHEGLAAELVLAADQFLIRPVSRTEQIARLRAEGDEPRTVIAGYHWFTDWGRDTMISLEGLTLTTGRATEAGRILRTFACAVRDGLIPNLFPEGEQQGLYHTADASLWFFHAVDRYLQATRDQATLDIVLPRLLEIVEHHVSGTRFGIGVDPQDGLLRQGAVGYQLTWMDAKVGDWVVTPRRGKAVEINALWYNALRLISEWLPAHEIGRWATLADKVKTSFNQRFWYKDGGHLFDVIDGEEGDDPAFRPNQLLAVSLKYPVLDKELWQPVVDAVKQRLLTPVGLRSLAPRHPEYRDKYNGDLRSRDAAYHQGTVWGWLIGPFIDAWLKVYPEEIDAASQFLTGFENHLSESCIGSISEIFDADEPFTARGCIAQAWSVAEVLRCCVKTSRHREELMAHHSATQPEHAEHALAT